ncbi:GNAT family N-acetyltransferase [Alloiococcus sp. CFN-8]|uniref:GNAT family N-acetyltransferase n=1 Tax=Alloiococcus sp. CFN-8 TaxID=3416081 RepID=UPI003CF5DDF5
MKFVFPTEEYKQKAVDFIEEFYSCSSEIHGAGSLDMYLKKYSYEQWIKKVIADLDIANIAPGRVPALTYFYIREDDGKIIGMINIRLALNDYLRKEGGHIGYSIRPSERRKGYGSLMLKEALEFCKIIGLNKVLITCDKSNMASAGVIKSCNGQLDEEFYSETFKEIIQRYVIV